MTRELKDYFEETEEEIDDFTFKEIMNREQKEFPIISKGHELGVPKKVMEKLISKFDIRDSIHMVDQIDVTLLTGGRLGYPLDEDGYIIYADIETKIKDLDEPDEVRPEKKYRRVYEGGKYLIYRYLYNTSTTYYTEYLGIWFTPDGVDTLLTMLD